MQEQNLDLPVCPSFNSYSSDKLVDTAAKVCREFGNLGLESSDLDLHPRGSEFDGDDDGFEFVSLFNAGDQVSVNGQMGQVFPVFNRDLLLDHGGDRDRKPDDDEDDEEESVPGPPSSSSSSEADELEGVPPGTYCVWTPKRVPESPGQCKKSKSTGSSSKRWRIRDLLRRCNSDGKDSFVFLTPLSSSKKMEAAADNNKVEKLNKEIKSSGSGSGSVSGTAKGKAKGVEKAHEAFYLRNRKLKEGDKRRSFLPYRQDLVGFFANVNAMGKSFPPF